MLRTSIQNIQDLAKVIKSTRKKQRMTQTELAGISGLGRRFISELENAKPTAQVAKVILVLNVLGVGLETIQTWDM
ncbi:MAG: transcriptional regulator [Gammaproteobacteria bacterium]|nr:transcriptional regulator [Gammaproteobacteria bacterium]